MSVVTRANETRARRVCRDWAWATHPGPWGQRISARFGRFAAACSLDVWRFGAACLGTIGRLGETYHANPCYPVYMVTSRDRRRSLRQKKACAQRTCSARAGGRAVAPLFISHGAPREPVHHSSLSQQTSSPSIARDGIPAFLRHIHARFGMAARCLMGSAPRPRRARPWCARASPRRISP